MMQRPGLSLVMTALLIVTIFCPAAYADQNDALINAIRRSDVKQVQELLKKGADAEAEDQHGSPAIVLAAESDYRGRMELVKLLLGKGAEVNATTRGGWTTLMEAAMRGHLDLVKLCLDRGADVDAKADRGRTALTEAAEAGRLEVVKLLLDKGAQVNAQANDGTTPLMKAAESDRLGVVKLLLDRGADADARAKYKHMTALVFAAGRGNLEIAKLLLDRGAADNANYAFGTALMKACEGGHLATARLLVARGAEVNATGHARQTALMKAAMAANLDLVRFLLEKGADINANDGCGETALMFASRNGNTAIAELLLNKGADVNSTRREGVTALMMAAEFGRLKTAQLLLDRGAQLNARDEKGRTALEHAAGGNHRPMVDFLVSRGAKTHLAVAAMVGDTAEVQRLLKEGADVNAKDKEGKTSLILAVEHGQLAVVKLLIKNRADVKTNAETALRIARRQGSDEIYTVLRSNGAKTREGLRILKYVDKVLRRGDELFFRLADGRIISRKDTPDQYSDSRVHREFSDFIEPWYVIDEHYYECSGGQLLHRGSGQSTTVEGSLDFSPDKARFLALGCPCGGGPDEIWKMTDSGPVKEHVVVSGGGYTCRWSDTSTVEVLSSGNNDATIVGRITLDAATGKWSYSRQKPEKTEQDSEETQQDSEEIDAGKMRCDTPDCLVQALINAVREGDVEAVKMLLAQGADVNVKTRYEETALGSAVSAGRLEITKLLLAKGADVNTKTRIEETALASAASAGRLEIIKLLLAKGAGKSESEKAKALVNAGCRKEVVDLLISHGAKLTLRVAAAIGDLKAMQRMIQRGDDVNAENKDVDSALSKALYCNQWDAAMLLLKNGAQIQDVDAGLLTAVAKDGHSGMIRTLLNMETIAKEKLLPELDLAASEGELKVVQLLLAKGADSNGKDTYARTPLMAAAIKGQPAVAEFLLAKGADANARDLDGATALMDAAWGGNPQMVKLLLQKGSEVNATDLDGRTALQYAKLSRNEEIVELLKAHGAKE